MEPVFVNKTEENSKELLDQVKEYMQLTTDLVLEEQEAALAELVRLENIIDDAAAQLRGSFSEIDNLIGQGLNGLLHDGMMAQAVNKAVQKDQSVKSFESQMSDQYRTSITALQFEDIVKQIIEHARKRGRGVDEILNNIRNHVKDLSAGNLDADSLRQSIEASREDIEKFREKMSSSNPVVQESLEIGDVELF